jgi:hypothetical protein
MDVTRSLLDDVQTKQLQRYGQSKGWRMGDCQKGYWNGDRQGEGNEADPNLPGRRGLEECWEKRGYRKRIGQIETIGGGT